MEFPINIVLGKFVIPSHLAFEMLAYFFGIRLYFYMRKKMPDSYDESGRVYLLIGAAAGALIGSHIIGILDHPQYIFHAPSVLFYLQTKSIVGGILGAIIGVEIIKKFYLKKSDSSGDIFTFPLLLGMAIGRIGCFLTGVSDSTVGNPSSLPWAINQGDHILRHPTSLYDIVFLCVLGLLLYNLRNKIHIKNGVLFRIFVVAYLAYRFLIEYLKPITPIFINLSAIQWASLSGVIAYLFSIWRLNHTEIGDLINFAVAQKCVRGVTFQPVQNAGQISGINNKNNLQNEKLTLTEIRNKIIKQTNIFTPEDLVAVPCHPDSLCMGYAIKSGDQITPLTRFVDPATLLEGAGNTISFERNENMKNELQKKAFQIFSTGCSPTESADRIHDLLCCLPKVDAPGLTYNNIFRVLIMRFMDADDFDIRSIRKSCVHIAHPDGRMIPFDTMNLFYRGKI
jgi:prolipoprotein diacylglyceryltransferase